MQCSAENMETPLKKPNNSTTKKLKLNDTVSMYLQRSKKYTLTEFTHVLY